MITTSLLFQSALKIEATFQDESTQRTIETQHVSYLQNNTAECAENHCNNDNKSPIILNLKSEKLIANLAQRHDLHFYCFSASKYVKLEDLADNRIVEFHRGSNSNLYLISLPNQILNSCSNADDVINTIKVENNNVDDSQCRSTALLKVVQIPQKINPKFPPFYNGGSAKKCRENEIHRWNQSKRRARAEFTHLSIAHCSGLIRCPRPFLQLANLLAFSIVRDTVPLCNAPITVENQNQQPKSDQEPQTPYFYSLQTDRSIPIEQNRVDKKKEKMKEERWRRIFADCCSQMRALFLTCNLVHGAIDPKKSLLLDLQCDHVWIVGFDASKERTKFGALRNLQSDCVELARFFSEKLGRRMPRLIRLFAFIIGEVDELFDEKSEGKKEEKQQLDEKHKIETERISAVDEETKFLAIYFTTGLHTDLQRLRQFVREYLDAPVAATHAMMSHIKCAQQNCKQAGKARRKKTVKQQNRTRRIDRKQNQNVL